jgi:hypothetical protein
MNTETYSQSEIEYYGHKIGAIKTRNGMYFLNPVDCETILDVPEIPLAIYIETNLPFLSEATRDSVYCNGYVSMFVVTLYWLSELAQDSSAAQSILMTFANEALFNRLESAKFS